METEKSFNDALDDIECPPAKNGSNHGVFCNPTIETLEKDAFSQENEPVFNDLNEKKPKKNVSFSDELSIMYSSDDQATSIPKKNLPLLGILCHNPSNIPSTDVSPLSAKPTKDLRSSDGLFKQVKTAIVVVEKLPSSLIHCESTNNEIDVCQKVYQTTANSCNSNSHFPHDEESLQDVTNSINSKSYRRADHEPVSILKKLKHPARELKVMLQRLPNNLLHVLSDPLSSDISHAATSSEIPSGAALVSNSENQELAENQLRVNQETEACKQRKRKPVRIVSSSKRKHELKSSDEDTNCSLQHPATYTPVEKLILSTASGTSEYVVGHEFEKKIEQNMNDEKRPRECDATPSSHRTHVSLKLMSKIQIPEYQDCSTRFSDKIPIVQLERVDLSVPVTDTDHFLPKDVNSKKNQNSPSLVSVLNHNSSPNLCLDSKFGTITPANSLSDKPCQAQAISIHEPQSSQSYSHLFHKRLCVHLERLDLGLSDVSPKLLKDAPEQNLSIKSVRNSHETVPFSDFNAGCSLPHSNIRKPKKVKKKRESSGLKKKKKKKSRQDKNGLQTGSNLEMRKNVPSPELSPLNLDCSNAIRSHDNVISADLMLYPLTVDYEVPPFSSVEVASQKESLLPKNRVISTLTNYRSLLSSQNLFGLSKSNHGKLILHSNSAKEAQKKSVKQQKHLIRDRDSSYDSSSSNSIPLSNLITADLAPTLPRNLSRNLHDKSYQRDRNLNSATEDSSSEENCPISNLLEVNSVSTSFLSSLTKNRNKKKSSPLKSALSNVCMDHCYNRKRNFQDVSREAKVKSPLKRIHVDHSYTSQTRTDHSYHFPSNSRYEPAKSQIISTDLQALMSNTKRPPSEVKRKQTEKQNFSQNTKLSNKSDRSSDRKSKNSVKDTLKKNSSRKTKRVTKKLLREKQAEIYDLIAKYLRRQIKPKSSKKKIRKKKHKNYSLNQLNTERQLLCVNTIAKSESDCDTLLAPNSSKASRSDDSFSNKTSSLDGNMEDNRLQSLILDIKVEPESDISESEFDSRDANVHDQSANCLHEETLTLNENTEERQLHAQSLNVKVEPECDDATVDEFDSRNTNVDGQRENCFPRETFLPLDVKVEPESDFSTDSADEFGSMDPNMHGQSDNSSQVEIVTPDEYTEERQPMIVEIGSGTSCLNRYDFDSVNTTTHDQSGDCSSAKPSTASESTEETQLQSSDIKVEPESDNSTNTTDELKSRITEIFARNGNFFRNRNSASPGTSCLDPVRPKKNGKSKKKKKSVDKYRLGFLSRNKSLRVYNRCFASERLLLSNSKLQKKQKQKLKKMFRTLNKVCHVKKV